MNLNDFARTVTLLEGGKKSVSINRDGKKYVEGAR